jgi:hypothetical protein
MRRMESAKIIQAQGRAAVYRAGREVVRDKDKEGQILLVGGGQGAWCNQSWLHRRSVSWYPLEH